MSIVESGTERLGEDIRWIVLRRDILDSNITTLYCISKEMVPNIDVFYVQVKFWVLRYRNSTLIITSYEEGTRDTMA